MDNPDAALPSRPSAPPPPPPRPAPGGYAGVFVRSCLVAGCATLLAPFALAAGLALAVFLVAGSASLENTGEALGGLGGPGGGDLRRATLRPGGPDSGDLLLVRIQGGIGGGGSPLDGEGMLADVSEQLAAAAGDDRVKAVLLQVDSPGGGLSASDMLHHEVEKLRRSGKPVLAWSGGDMESGGYYVAVAAQGIMAGPTATVGSIGVILPHFQAAEALAKLGIKFDPVTSGSHKDLGSPFREMTPEERRLLQEHVAASHRRFVDIVARGRQLPAAQVERLANGDIFTAEAALRHGLVDRVGYVEDALEWAGELAGDPNLRVVAYRRPLSLERLLREAGREGVSSFWSWLALRVWPAGLE